MGILSFARDGSRRVFDRDERAAQSLKKHLDLRLTPIRGLSVGYDDGAVTLAGECLDQAHQEQAVLLAGNVKGVEQVIADKLQAPAAGTPPQNVEFDKIKKGDTLSAAAKRYYGEAECHPCLFEANRDVIGDPNMIDPAQMIRIPLD